MAEGVDNDMSQQQQQESVPHGQEAFHTPSVHFGSTPLDAIPSTPVIQLLAPTNQPTANPGQKKKSAFQITSVTEARVHSRGDSNGYDLEDLNESDVTEIEVETVGETSSGNGNGGSRFKVVKIQRNEPYKRGRWLCHDFPDIEQPTSSSQDSADSRELHSTISNVSSSVSSTVNHVSVNSNAWTESSLPNHRNSLDLPPSSKQPLQAQNLVLPAAVHVNFEANLRKKGSDLHLSSSTKPDIGDVGYSGLTATVERIDKLTEGATSYRQIAGVTSSAVAAPTEELPIVNTIATAMDQITQIKSALLTVVHEEVQTLKDTIAKLKEENQELKLENERLKLKVDNKTT